MDGIADICCVGSLFPACPAGKTGFQEEMMSAFII